MAPTTTQDNDTRDAQTLVAVVHKDQIEGGKVKDGVSPGIVRLSWLRLGSNAENWIEIDQATGKKVTAAQIAKATDSQEG